MVLAVPDPDALFAKALAAGAGEVTAMQDAYGWHLGRVVIRSAITGRSADPTHEALLEPHRQSHSRHRPLNRRVDLPGPTGIRLAIDPLERVARRAVQPPRQADVEAEPQVDREPRMAAAGELRRREIVGAEQHGGSRPDLVERSRSDTHRSH